MSLKTYFGKPPSPPKVRPSLGRIVLYKSVEAGEEQAAIISRVYNDDSVNLHILRDSGDVPIGLKREVMEGNLPGQWRWPPRIG